MAYKYTHYLVDKDLDNNATFFQITIPINPMILIVI